MQKQDEDWRVKLQIDKRTVEDSFFAGCKSLTEVNFGLTTQEIGDGAFAHCENLVHVTGGSRVTTVGEGAFDNCPKLVDESKQAIRMMQGESDAEVAGIDYLGTVRSEVAIPHFRDCVDPELYNKF